MIEPGQQRRICERHLEYKVPFLFVNDLFLCPYCGNTGDVFRVGVDIITTEEHENRLMLFQILHDESTKHGFKYHWLTKVELWLPF